MRQIALTKGKVALVDDEDFKELSKHKWHTVGRPQGPYYAGRAITLEPKTEGRRRRITLRMHCEILGLKGVDHENGNGLDNQRQNLRPASQRENNRNAGKRSGTKLKRLPTSRYKGVSQNLGRNDWRAQILVDGKKIHLGHHRTEIEAAKAYDKAASEHFGEFARLNFSEKLLDNSTE